MNKIIAISRYLAQAMNIAYYGQEIVAALIKRTKKQRNMSATWKKNARCRCSQLQPQARSVCQQIVRHREPGLLYAGEQNYTESCRKI